MMRSMALLLCCLLMACSLGCAGSNENGTEISMRGSWEVGHGRIGRR